MLGVIVVMIVVVVTDGWRRVGRLADGIRCAARMITISVSTVANTAILRRAEVERLSSFGTVHTLSAAHVRLVG